MKYILNDRDSLSVAEILLLADGRSIESIIDHRIRFLAKEEHSSRWANELDVIKDLKDLRKEVSELSSSEILNLVLEKTDIRRVVVVWGNPQQRLSNIDQFSKLALQYEETCNRLHTAASLGGFLLWLAELESAGIDAQGSGESPDSVNVLTYHKSKGLEWPFVICHSLEQPLRDNVWGLSIKSDATEVDLTNILGNRWIRYWINPYADQIRKTPLEDRINESDAKQKAKSDALQEEARLLYVGMTRARDYLIIPTRKKPTKWLNRCCFNDEKIPTLDPNNHETPWVWKEDILLKNTTIKHFPKIFEHIPLLPDSVLYFEAREGQKDHPNHFIDISEEDYSDDIDYKIKRIFNYYDSLNLHEEVDDYAAAKALKSFIAIDNDTFTYNEKIDIVEGLISRLGEDLDLLPAKLIVQSSKYFYDQLNSHFNIQRIVRKYPIKTGFQWTEF